MQVDKKAILTRTFAAWLGALVAICSMLMVLSGCGGSGAGASLGTGGGSGTLAVHLADAPISGVTAVNVTISRVDAHIDNSWVTLASPNQTYNLLDLAQHDTLLAQAPLPAGNYTQIRLIVPSATVEDGTGVHNVNIPSGVQTGIKLNVDFAIQPDVITDVLLDFNVSKSLHVLGNGQYQLQPVIPAVIKTLSGTISGSATSGGNPIAGVQVDAVYVQGTNYALGTTVNSTTTLADGSFKIWTLLPGSYDLHFTYTDPVSSAVQQGHVLGVVVTAGQDTNVGPVALFTPGSISGTALSAAVAVGGVRVDATYDSGGSYPSGTPVATTVSANDGTFQLQNLAPGTYTLTLTYDVPNTSTVETATVTAVVVAEGLDTPVGSVTVV